MKTSIFRGGRFVLATTLISAAAIVGATSSTLSQVIFSDDFESYPDDAALTTVWQRVSGTSSSIFLVYDPTNRNQSVFQTTAAGRLRHVMIGTVPTDSTPLVYSFDFFDMSGLSAGRVYSEIRNSASASGLFAAGIYNTVNTGTYDITRYQARNVDNGGWIQLAATRSVGWHNFRFEISGNTVDLYVDNVLDPAFAHLPYSGNVPYDWLNLGSALSGNSGALFDNVNLALVPEPSAAVLGLLAAATLLARRRLRR